jgi:hypothetical protein
LFWKWKTFYVGPQAILFNIISHCGRNSNKTFSSVQNGLMRQVGRNFLTGTDVISPTTQILEYYNKIVLGSFLPHPSVFAFHCYVACHPCWALWSRTNQKARRCPLLD